MFSESAARWFSVVVTFGSGVALVAYGLYIRLGYSKQYWLRGKKGPLGPPGFESFPSTPDMLRGHCDYLHLAWKFDPLGPATHHVLPLMGAVLCLLGATGLLADPDTRRALLILLVSPAALATLLIRSAQPSWLKPSWLSHLEREHPDTFPLLREAARKQVGRDREKAAEWAMAMADAREQDEWVARVRSFHQLRYSDLRVAEMQSMVMPTDVRERIGDLMPMIPGGQEQQPETHERILAQLRQDEAPAFWASEQKRLGDIYLARLRGNRHENLEKAIAAYEAAREAAQLCGLRILWADAQARLGEAYGRRIQGDRAENKERATAPYESALKVFNREDSPCEWARIQADLGFAYSRSVRGERRENLDQAIAAYRRALEVYCDPLFPFPRNQAKVEAQLQKALEERQRL